MVITKTSSMPMRGMFYFFHEEVDVVIGGRKYNTTRLDRVRVNFKFLHHCCSQSHFPKHTIVSPTTMAPLSALVYALTCFFFLGRANASLRGAAPTQDDGDSPRRRDYTIAVVPPSLPGATTATTRNSAAA